MRSSRRRFLTTSAAALTFPVVGGAQVTTAEQSGQITPSSPESNPVDPVMAEIYGELQLPQDDPFWTWDIPYFSDDAIIEYEVRPKDGDHLPDVLVVDDDGLEKYRTQVASIPLYDTRSRDLGWFGSVPWPVVYFDNIPRKLDQVQPWDVEGGMVDIETLDCLTNAQPRRDANVIAGGDYHLVFDWTDEVLSNPGNEDVTVEVSARVRRNKPEEAAEVAPAQASTLYTTVGAAESPVVEAMVPVAEAICSRVPDKMKTLSVEDVQTEAPRAVEAVAVTRIVFAVLDDKFGYTPTFVRQLLDGASTWARWGRSALPVVNSIDHVIDDACRVVGAEPGAVTDAVEDLLLSLGILVADLLMAKFGLVSRVASFGVKRAHTYLLGVIGEVLGLKAYLVLLRELYNLLEMGIQQTLRKIKSFTRDIEEHGFLTDDEVATVQEFEQEEDLQSLDSGWDLRVGPLNPSPECQS